MVGVNFMANSVVLFIATDNICLGLHNRSGLSPLLSNLIIQSFRDLNLLQELSIHIMHEHEPIRVGDSRAITNTLGCIFI